MSADPQPGWDSLLRVRVRTERGASWEGAAERIEGVPAEIAMDDEQKSRSELIAELRLLRAKLARDGSLGGEGPPGGGDGTVDGQGGFFTVFQMAPIPMAVSAVEDGRFLAVNDAFVHATGYPRETILSTTSMDLGFISPARRKALFDVLAAGRQVRDVEIEGMHGSGRPLVSLLSAERVEIAGRPCLLSIAMDITQKKLDESARKIAMEMLGILNRTSGLREMISDAVRLIHRWSGCRMAAVRLREGARYPYVAVCGSEGKTNTGEAPICVCSCDICALHEGDTKGDAAFGCVCGRVIRRKGIASLSCFTDDGSFWINRASELRSSLKGADAHTPTLLCCEEQKYESMTIVPLRYGDETLGLLQIADERTDRFSRAEIAVYERLAASLAIGIAHRRSANRWNATFDSMEDAIFILDTEGVILQCNGSAEKHFKVPREKMLQKRCGEVIPSGSDMWDKRLFSKVKRSLKPAVLVLPMDERWLEIKVEPMVDDSGELEGAIQVVKDITERRRSLDRLELSYFYLTRAQEIGAIGTWELDVPSNTMKWTDQTYHILGIRTGTAVTYDTFLERVHADDRELFQQEWARALEGKPYDIEHRLLVDGKVKWVREKADVTCDANGKGIHAIGVTQDITERKKAEQDREKLQMELVQAHKMESVGRLAGGVAHDFNNMLSVILGHAEVALGKIPSSDPLHDHLTEIQVAATRSADLTRQLLVFARKQAAVPRALDVNQTIAGMLKMLMRLIGEEIALKWNPGEGVWPVKMDPSQLDQVLTNLCVNARDAIDGVGTVSIETRNTRFDEGFCVDHPGVQQGDYLTLSVIDDGLGMGRETLSHLFEPFYTTKEVGKGTGLGLATVYGVVRQNNGLVQVISEIGKGTTFNIFLPRYSGRSKAEFAADQRPEPAHVSGREIVLLVEDEPAILKLGTEILESLGYRVVSASTPGEAIRLARAHPGEIHLLLTDVVMPEMNGRELAKRLLPLHPKIRRLFMSGYTADVIAGRGGLEAGIHFLQKPFTTDTLSRKVREALDS